MSPYVPCYFRIFSGTRTERRYSHAARKERENMYPTHTYVCMYIYVNVQKERTLFLSCMYAAKCKSTLELAFCQYHCSSSNKYLPRRQQPDKYVFKLTFYISYIVQVVFHTYCTYSRPLILPLFLLYLRVTSKRNYKFSQTSIRTVY